VVAALATASLGIAGVVIGFKTALVGTAIVSATGAFVGIGVAVATVLSKIRRNATPVYASYLTDRSCDPLTTRVVHLPSVVRLPSTDPPLPVEDMLALPLDPSALLVCPDPTARKEERNPVCVAGLVSTVSTPIAPSASCVSALSSHIQRQLKIQPVSTLSFDPLYFGRFEKWVATYAHEFFDGIEANPLGYSNFQAWNERFPVGLQRVHDKALDGVNCALPERVNTRGGFVKMEGANKSDVDGVAKVAYRAIQSAEPSHNVLTGPFMLEFSKYLRACWSTIHDVGPVYTSGLSGADIGKYFYESANGIDTVVFEGDFVKYDSSMHPGLLRIENYIYMLAGASQYVLDSVERSIDTHGFDKWNNEFGVFGTRHSGDPNTSCGNTLIQGLTNTFVLATILDPHDPPSPIVTWQSTGYRALLLGDDSCISLARSVDPGKYVEFHAKLGLELELVVHRGLEAVYLPTFCSSRFYPVDDEFGQPTCVLAPPIGRVMSKAGHFTELPASEDPQSFVKGDALCRMQDSHCIPFLCEYWKTVERLSHKSDAKVTASMKRNHLHNPHLNGKFVASRATWTMLEFVYRLSRVDLQRYVAQLATVKSLPAVLDNEMFAVAFLQDGIAINATESLAPLPPRESPPVEAPPLSTEVVGPIDQILRCARVCPNVVRRPRTQDHVDFDVSEYRKRAISSARKLI
jgi:hypothetical protein